MRLITYTNALWHYVKPQSSVSLKKQVPGALEVVEESPPPRVLDPSPGHV